MFEPTNSCNNFGKCKKKKSNNSWSKWFLVCVIPNETFTWGELSQLQAPDPSFVQGQNLVFYIKLLQPPLNKNSSCLNFSWHQQQQNSSFRLIKAKIQTDPENQKSSWSFSLQWMEKEVTESALPQKTHYYSQKDNYTWTWTISYSIPFGSLTHGNHKQTFNPSFKSIWSEKQFKLKK